MAILSADMSTCNKKERCLNGVNEGLAYDPLDPCPRTLIGGFPQKFNPTTCNCEEQNPTKRTRMIYVSSVGLGGSWTPGETVLTANNAYFDSGGNLVTYTLSLLPFFGVNQPETSPYSGECNGFTNSSTGGKCYWATYASLLSESDCYCFGCGDIVVWPVMTKFVNGQYTSFDVYYAFHSATGTNVCYGTFPSFYSVTVRYEIENQPNVWTDFVL